jgi:mono/diheme cytochrome c family protein
MNSEHTARLHRFETTGRREPCLPPDPALCTKNNTGYMRILIMIGLLCSVPSGYAVAQNAEAGQNLAVQICSRCHAVLRGEGANPKPEPLPFRKIGRPLPFEDIANTPGVTEMALYAWLTSSHPTMPNIVLDKEQLTNVVAYILSLKKNQP